MHAQRKDPVRKQGEALPSASQGEKPQEKPNQLDLDLRLAACKTVRKKISVV